MSKIDSDKSGYIDYSEFVAASMDGRTLLSKNNLESAFGAFDKDGSGTITVNEIRGVIGAFSSGSDNTTWEKVLKEVDQDGNGEIDIKEFKDMMLRLF
jgi:calcium-dependent protein kinase